MRLTLDLDRIKRHKLEGIAGILKVLFPNKTIKYRISSNKRGGHVVVYDTNLSYIECLEYRRFFGDDAKRISKDIHRQADGLPINVLFTGKIKTGYKESHRRAGHWIEIEQNRKP